MEIGRKFNKLSKKEYFFYIDNYKKYTDFNTLGLYRSIVENVELDIADKKEVRDYAHKTFRKTFDFLQLKDPNTYFELTTLGKKLTKADESQVWQEIISNQQKILVDKKIKHRNFGEYSKHNCGYETCPMNGLMIKQGSWFTERHMQFNSDNHKYSLKIKSERIKIERKNKKRIIDKKIEIE